MQIDWMIVSYLVVGFFAVLGFFRGWWKEAITTFLLALLVLLLQHSNWAQTLIDWINKGIATVLLLLADIFGFTASSDTIFQLDASRPSTWLGILLLTLGLSALFARFFLPGTASKIPAQYYTVTLIGRLLGVMVGGLNGFLIINLVREYLDGRNLPGSTPVGTSAVAQSGSAASPALSTLTIQAVNLPSSTILDSYIPWLIVGGGVLILLAIIWSRIRIARKAGAGSKLEFVPPFGYKPFKIERPPRREPQEVRVIS
jgi:hypothetical protein